LSIYHEAYKAP